MSSRKVWWKSRTLWLNALVLAVATAESQSALLREVMPTNTFVLISIGLPVVNMLLRVATRQPLGRTPVPRSKWG